MSTLKESTEKLVAATDKLLQDYELERVKRRNDREKAEARVFELEAQLKTAQNSVETYAALAAEASSDAKEARQEAREEAERQMEHKALNDAMYEEHRASEIYIPNPPIQSPDSANLSADQIDALVQEIDTCLNLLKI